jgi:hypothetical protein
MKSSKILVLVTTTLAVFGIGHVRALIAHGQFGCAMAAAQSWDDGTSGADDAAAEPDKAPPPNVAGDWEGEIEDLDFGDSAIDVEFNQKGTKLSGSFDCDFGGGPIKGSINGDGDVKLNMKAGKGGCHLNAVGQETTPGEIQMTYQVKSCKGSKKDHGTIDIFLLP